MTDRRLYARPEASPRHRTISPLAIAALVLGGLGFSFLPLVGSVAALIVGRLARQRIAANPTHWRGDELAAWGIRLGWVAVLLATVLGALVLTMRIMFAPEN